MLNPSPCTDKKLQATDNRLVSSTPRSFVRPSSKDQGKEKLTCNMPLVALATAAVFAVRQSASEKKAKKQQDRASQRGLHFAPETDRNDVNSHSKVLEQITE